MSLLNFDQSQAEACKARLKSKVYTKVADLSVACWRTPEPVPFSEKESGDFRELHIGESWGGLWDCAWMHFTGEIPLACRGSNVVLRVDLSGEGCVFDCAGNPVQGITTYVSEFDGSLGMPVKRVIPFANCCQGGEKVDVWIEAGCNDLFGNYRNRGELSMAEVSVCDTAIRKLYYDYTFLLMLAEATDNPEQKHCLQQVTEELSDLAPANIAMAQERMTAILEKRGADDRLRLSAIGHAHIDLAWLWPIRETKRKGARTFSTALRMMERYPDYVFGASQPQLYQWIKDLYPDLYRRIGERVREGRWECQGAMWVEADTNISGGEALVRQLMYGKAFFRKEFGQDMRVLWLPDVFGYSAALPQLMRLADVEYFMTIKLSWNTVNRFPHNTFRWKGVDGSEVLAHMPPEGNYNSGATPLSLQKNREQFLDMDVSREALLLFGIGDGGGGPGTDHLEWLSRERDIDGLPMVTQSDSLSFFERLDCKRDSYAAWQGELYLERHQGTYTTQSRNKYYNRKMELLLRDTEYLCSLAAVRLGWEYPASTLEKIWKEVLLYQFHDILPGSSIKRVYDESVQRYERLMQETTALRDEALNALAAAYAGQGCWYVNTLSCTHRMPVWRDGCWKQLELGPLEAVREEDAVLSDWHATPVCDGLTMENAGLRVQFSEDGRLVSLWDKQAERELIRDSDVNSNLVVFDDSGDAWDMEDNYMNQQPKRPAVTSARNVQIGPHPALELTYSFGQSSFTQTVYLDGDSKLLHFSLTVDWHETGKMLRARYPMALLATQANCQIQFGHIARPTHRNTSWDVAKYEVCAHQWVDISEVGYGVALLNDCKYGFRVTDNVLDMNVLRSTMHPGIDADKGTHTCEYEIFVHDGDLLKVHEQAARLNTPILCAEKAVAGRSAAWQQPIRIDRPNVVMETLKISETGNSAVFRLYECEGRQTRATVTVPGARSVRTVNLLENADGSAEGTDTMRLAFHPFAIVTVEAFF